EALKADAYYPLAVGNRWTYRAKVLNETTERAVTIVDQADGFYRDTMGGKLMADPYGVRDDRRYLLRTPVRPGHTWTNVVSVSSVEHYQILDVANCEVPAGRFKDCVRVEGRNPIDNERALLSRWTF